MPSYIPLEDFELEHSPQNLNDTVSSSSPNVHGKNDDTQICGFKKHSVVLFCKTFVRCLVTAIFVAFLLATLKIYQNKGYFASRQKTNFNVIITALSLCLGLNFFDSFKDLANVLRWKIRARYARKHRGLEDLIFAIESLVNVVRLGWKSRAIAWLCIFCITWVFLNLLAQISVALINLTYNLNDGTDWRGTYTGNGIVNASNLSCYRHKNGPCEGQRVQQGLAHAYGESFSIIRNGSYDQIEDLYKSSDSIGYYCRKTLGECAYRFVEYNPEDQLKTYPSLTNRVITASAGQCSTYPKIKSATKGDALEFKISNDPANGTISIPKELGGMSGTTYIYRGFHPPSGAGTFACGDRCIKMWAHTAAGYGDDSTFYECPISISNVSNIENETQNVPDDVARLAAAAIALQGRPLREPFRQYQFYPYGNELELHHLDATKAGANMAEFAIRSLSTMADKNPPRQAPGLVPHLGTGLEVFWKYALVLCSCIVVVQLALSISVYVMDVEPIERDTVVR